MDTKKTAIGIIYLLGNRFITLSCGLTIHIFLARWLGPEIYGLYGLIMSILLWAEYTVIYGVPSTYRKVLSEDETMFPSVVRSIKKIFVPYCLGTWAVFSLASPLVSQILNDNRLLLLLLIAGMDIPLYGIFAAYLGILNGQREFIRQSAAGMGYILSKTIFIIVIILLQFGILGALIANVLASFFGVLITLRFVKGLKCQNSERKPLDLWPRIVTFGIPYLSYMVVSLLLIHIDMWFVKALLHDNAMIGFYSASWNLARPVYFLIAGILLVVFPSMSRAASENNSQLLSKYIRQAMRLALVILFPVLIIIGSTCDELITLLFTSVYLPASSSLKILLVGMSLFSIFSLFLNVIAAYNKPFHSFIISVMLLPLVGTLDYYLINSYGIDGAAMATTIISAIGVVVSGVYLWRQVGVIMSFTTLWKVTLASGCLYIISKCIACSGYYLIIEYLLLSLIYLFLLWVLCEINRGDITIVKGAFSPRFRH